MEYTKEDFDELVKEENGESNLDKKDFQQSLFELIVIALLLFVLSNMVYAIYNSTTIF